MLAADWERQARAYVPCPRRHATSHSSIRVLYLPMQVCALCVFWLNCHQLPFLNNWVNYVWCGNWLVTLFTTCCFSSIVFENRRTDSYISLVTMVRCGGGHPACSALGFRTTTAAFTLPHLSQACCSACSKPLPVWKWHLARALPPNACTRTRPACSTCLHCSYSLPSQGPV